MAHFYNPVKKCGCDSNDWLLPNPGRKLQPLRKTKTERPNKGHTTARSIPGTRRNAEDASAYANRYKPTPLANGKTKVKMLTRSRNMLAQSGDKWG